MWSMTVSNKWVSHTLMALGLTASATGAAGAESGAPPRPTIIGINLSSPVRYHRTRVFANLLLGASWTSRLPEYKDKQLKDIDEDGNPKLLPEGAPLWWILTNPNAGTREADIRCTYQGRGEITPMAATNVRSGRGFFSFHWDNSDARPRQVTLRLSASDPADPIRGLDCRETTLPASARFDPQFIESLRGFKVVRFMDWQNTNGNTPVTWATRHTRNSLNITRDDGVPIEDMIALANEARADPWFTMPWNADDDYITRFARLVHDTLAPDRTAYVELGNEVWNMRFLMAKQAMREGQAAGLSGDANVARARRYAQRMVQVMDIWKNVFADRPGKLVRVA
ncbi:MAG: hypothetical protein JWR77_2426, partial [Rhizorhabdus sp.]|nr:hypothetical protein [Rhizorhabdus sp.]